MTEHYLKIRAHLPSPSLSSSSFEKHTELTSLKSFQMFLLPGGSKKIKYNTGAAPAERTGVYSQGQLKVVGQELEQELAQELGQELGLVWGGGAWS